MRLPDPKQLLAFLQPARKPAATPKGVRRPALKSLAFKLPSFKRKSGRLENIPGPAPAARSEPSQAMLRLLAAGVTVLVVIGLMFVLYLNSGMPGLGLRYLVLPPLMLVLALLAAGSFVRRIYGLASLSLGMKYVLASVFGIGYPALVVDCGRMQLSATRENLLHKVGGPGWLYVRPGNVALVEGWEGQTRVCGVGAHFIEIGQRIKEVHCLEEQEGEIDPLNGVTREGIEIKLRNVRFRYRLYDWPDDPAAASADPFPFSAEAVRNLVYNRNFTPDGPVSWARTISQAIDTKIADYIGEHTLDELMAPGSTQMADPREEIRSRLDSPGAHAELRKRGARLVWYDIGHFEPPIPDVDQQRVQTWQSRWMGDTQVTRAYGEAQRQAYEELARAEGQAELVMSIMSALDNLDLEKDTRKNLQRLLLRRTAQVIDDVRDQVAVTRTLNTRPRLE